MRTITESLFHRLAAQAQEAEFQGLTKVAASLTTQLENHSSNVRKDAASYSYNEDNFRMDINTQMWNSIIRAADFYGVKKFDASEIQELIEKTSQELISSFCIHAGISHGVGAYEDRVPGELIEKTSIEVSEEDVNG